MRVIKFLIILMMSWMTLAATFDDYRSVDAGGDMLKAFQSFGQRLIRRRSTNQEKRDISLSYAATNINNKEGTQVKTITVIKNSSDKDQKLKINPELHKNENWGQAFKDNFDSYGIIPDVPDVDDLFEYVNKNHNKDDNKNEKKETKTDEKKTKEETAPKPKQKSPSKEKEKPLTEVSTEISKEIKENLKPVEKIKGDAELLPSFNSSRLKVRESLINLNYSTPQHSVHQYFDNYVQLSQGGKEFGYDYQKPCVHPQPVGSVTIATPSGRTYNVPSNNNSYINPYLAPGITRRPQMQQTSQIPPANAPVFPVNSLLPPLQQQQPNNNPTPNNFLTQQQQNSAGGTQQNQQQPQQPNISLQAPNFQTSQQQPQNSQSQNNIFSTSQRPYVAPNIRSGLGGVSRGPSSTLNSNGFQNGQLDYRTFNNGLRKTNIFRSRGLKY